ncbi:hypothetical protein GUITHDRAFT_110558 [Guillardia theta CCMP2712]|uniref:Uncharacterized protein n=1 Tax=Guillardia theta (strain CCMP2712) TaxID=905079 RepID=L1J5S7_GUITC|nr:hypothetical protein GUITHDRAFT_110558 [Guillardia theta CCMP2712]EKX43435.1 hypothetical protein GUITHDRAFT_110558 [Guillardia theta CCMP2712]|eukprot:XP_005830415.1 hypothetical protein GUITHDRAFT_110558 [Guillardia theta CCMP2712]
MSKWSSGLLGCLDIPTENALDLGLGVSAFPEAICPCVAYFQIRKRMVESAPDEGLYLIQRLFGKDASADKHAMGLTELNSVMLDAIQRGDLQMCNAMVKQGANVNVTDHAKATPLMFAAQNRQLEICAILLENKADVNAKDRGGMTACHRAALVGDVKVLELLIKKGAKRGIEDGWGKTPMDTKEKLQQLVGFGVDDPLVMQ